MSLSPEIFDFDRVHRQRYHENQALVGYPNLSETELISARTQEGLYTHLGLPLEERSRPLNAFQVCYVEKCVMNNARQIISVVSEMEGTLIAVLGDLSIYSRQDTWDGRDVSLFGAGMGLVLKAVEIECGRRALREMNELEEEKVLPVIEKVALLPGRHKAQREVGDIFPPFPPGQTLLNETIGVLGDIICDNPAERFVLESGAVGTYYIIEEASEWVQGIKKAA